MIAQDIEKILLSEEEIENRCVELAHQIEEDYKESGETPIVVGLLKGSVPFMAELIKRFEFPCEIDFMSVSSYDGTESIGDVRILKDMDLSCRNRSILVVEDIIDTGHTAQFLTNFIKNNFKTKSMKFISLLDKRCKRVVDINPDMYGFTIDDKFLVGYGLDYDGYYRNLTYVGYVEI